jgi:hypothetical protein
MSMTKIITPGAQDFHEPVAELLKISSRGLRGSDLDHFVKRASVQFMDKIASIKWHPGEIPVHLIAVGASERYGSNRNGDAFSRDVCRTFHPTFKKYARWYRNHQNKDTSKGRGIIKMSAFNDDMDRVELLLGLNGTKEAAEHNGGLVADDEMEKLAQGEDIPVSMACRVSHDICSGCHNKARTRREYCGPDTCVKYGGCRDNLAKTFEDGHTLHVDNPDPNFFDISKVWRPADRIAYTLGKCAHYEEMLKAACDAEEKVGGAEWAERLGVSTPLWVIEDGPWADPRLTGQLKIAAKLMDLEEHLDVNKELSRAFMPEVQPTAGDLPEVHRTEKLGHVLAALAERNCMLPIDEFLSLISGQGREKVAYVAEAVAGTLPGVYNRLSSDPTLENRIRNNPYIPATVAPQKLKHWALKHAADWSLDRDRVIRRLQLSVLRHPKPPSPRPAVKAAAAGKADELATEYAMYQLAFLQAASAAKEPELAQEMVILHNYVK